MTLGYRRLDEREITVGTCGIGGSVFLPGEFHKQKQRVDNCVPVCASGTVVSGQGGWNTAQKEDEEWLKTLRSGGEGF